MLKTLKRKASDLFRINELKYIEDFFDTRVKEIPITKTSSEEWEETFKRIFESCNLDHNNNGNDLKNFIEMTVKNKNDYDNELEQRMQYKDKRIVEYNRVINDLDAGIDRSKKDKTRYKVEQETLNRELDSKYPVSFYLKDEYREFIVGLIVLAEAILFYSTSTLIFNNNPEVNIMITLSLAGASILLVMLLANEMGNGYLKSNQKGITWQEKFTIGGVVIVFLCYVWFRVATKHVIEFASESLVVEWAGTIMIALTPLFISLVAFKLEYYAYIDENLKKRREFIAQEMNGKCQRVKESFPTVEEFEMMENEHIKCLMRNVENAITEEVRFGMSCFNYLHVQNLHANPAQFFNIMSESAENYRFVREPVNDLLQFSEEVVPEISKQIMNEEAI